ncbi:MAG: cell division protein FtsA [Candidatus Tectomicrobia bacterium]|nr:cell division protein FtsA [Candidatus Tectomicrobia bacterium]
MAKKRESLVGLDIGTATVCALIGEPGEGKEIEIVGVGSSPSKGFRKGTVVNVESTKESIKKAIEEAEYMAGVKVHSAYVGVSGVHIEEIGPQRGSAPVEATVAQPRDRRIFHAGKSVTTESHQVSSRSSLDGPIPDRGNGKPSQRMEENAQLVPKEWPSISDLIKSVQGAGLSARAVLLEQVVSAEAVLTPEEKESGVALVNIGGGTTDIALYLKGTVKYTASLPLGGSHITNDIAICLKTSMSDAEKVKKRYGCAFSPLVSPKESLQIPLVGGKDIRVISRRELVEVIEPRVEEIFEYTHHALKGSGIFDLATSGIVLTGGTVIMEGMTEAASQVFHSPVRIGIPQGVSGLVDIVGSPLYAAGVGLIFYGARHKHYDTSLNVKEQHGLKKALFRMRSWLGDFF